MGKRQEDIKKQAEECRQKGLEAFERQNQVEAIQYIQEAMELLQQCGDEEEFARCMNIMGVLYSSMGDEMSAVDYYLEGLEYAKNRELYDIMGSFYNNIGSRYQEIGQHKKAIYYFEVAMENQRKAKNPEDGRNVRGLFVECLNLAMSYQKLGDWKKAQVFIEEAEQILESRKEDRDWKGFGLIVLVLKCSINWDRGIRENLEEQSESLLDLCKNSGMYADYAQNVRELADLYCKIQNFECWNRLLSYVSDVAEQQGSTFFELLAVEMWMDYYQALGEEERYRTLCVQHAKLYYKQKKIHDRERSKSLDVRIALREKEEQYRAAEKRSMTDTLTGLGNRYALEEDMRTAVRTAAASRQLIAVGILDVDCFKQVNDTYGHNTGDMYLKKVGEILRQAVGNAGRAYRFGGDEFVILLPQGDYDTAVRIGAQVKGELAIAGIENKYSTTGSTLTLSQGYACFLPYEGERLAGLLEHADKALYQVKESGRNDYRVVLEES